MTTQSQNHKKTDAPILDAQFPQLNLEGRHRRLAALISVIVGILLLMIKFWAHSQTGSQAIFSDAMESIVNVVAAFMLVFIVSYAAKPKDQDHPYGHGKSEYFSSVFEGGLISFAAVMILLESIDSWQQSTPLKNLDWGTLVVSLAGLVNLALGFYLKKIGGRLNSVALAASGEHVISDFWTSFATVISLILVNITGLRWIDPLFAVFFAGWLGFTGFKILKSSISGLMDQEDPQVLQSLTEVFKKNVLEGIIQIHHVRVIRSGDFHHIDAHVVMPEYWDVLKVHAVIDQFEDQVIRDYQFGGEMNLHVDPCRQVYCRVCDIQDCKVRRSEFEAPMPIEIQDLRSPEEPAEFRRLRSLRKSHP